MERCHDIETNRNKQWFGIWNDAVILWQTETNGDLENTDNARVPWVIWDNQHNHDTSDFHYTSDFHHTSEFHYTSEFRYNPDFHYDPDFQYTSDYWNTSDFQDTSVMNILNKTDVTFQR